MGYSKDLQNGQWQKKRLEILQRDNFKCLCCGSANSLVVHHLFYKYGLKPWQYPNDSLVTLCELCHTKLHDELSEKAGKLAFELLTGIKIGSNDPIKSMVTKEKNISDNDLPKAWTNVLNEINLSDKDAANALCSANLTLSNGLINVRYGFKNQYPYLVNYYDLIKASIEFGLGRKIDKIYFNYQPIDDKH